MPKRFIISLLLLATGFLPSFGADKQFSALEIINTEGILTISDGSSTYTFKKDGTFVSMPVGISGRTIEGKWSSLGVQSPMDLTVRFVVNGKWGWVNGISPNDDHRTMALWIYPVSSPTQVRVCWPFLGSSNLNAKVYKCYFLIDELRKKPEESSKTK